MSDLARMAKAKKPASQTFKITIKNSPFPLDIKPVETNGFALLHVWVGNDHYPVMDPTILDNCKKLVTDELKALGVNLPIYVTNHTVQLHVIPLK